MCAALQRVGDRPDVGARADEDRAAAVADLLQQTSGHLRVHLAQRGVVDDAEGERAVEDPVAGEVLSVDEREDEPDQRRLKEAGRDLHQAGSPGTIGIQVQPGERQHGEQVGEREEVVGAAPGDRP
jgi:hypothetical protein